MNKQELIESISHLPSDCSRPRPMIDKLTTLELIELLDEPQKTVVPQFVADWIFKAQLVNDFSLCIALEHTTIKLYANNSEEILKWLEIRKNQETFALAWVNGYEVEKEKRYLVKIKGIEEDINYLNYDYSESGWYFADDENGPVVRTHHTRDELENAGFGWVFDCEGIEIEEVE